MQLGELYILKIMFFTFWRSPSTVWILWLVDLALFCCFSGEIRFTLRRVSCSSSNSSCSNLEFFFDKFEMLNSSKRVFALKPVHLITACIDFRYSFRWYIFKHVKQVRGTTPGYRIVQISMWSWSTIENRKLKSHCVSSLREYQVLVVCRSMYGRLMQLAQQWASHEFEFQ